MSIVVGIRKHKFRNMPTYCSSSRSGTPLLFCMGAGLMGIWDVALGPPEGGYPDLTVFRSLGGSG